MNPTAEILAGLVALILLALVNIYGPVSSSSSRRSQGASLSAIDFARGSFASQLSHGVPMNELLLQLVEALRDTFKLDAAELWLCTDDRLSLEASEPRAERTTIAITPAEQSIAANARVSSEAWAKVWLPELLPGRPNSTLRTAPITHGGQLLGLIVAERARRPGSLASEADVTLEEVAREVGVAVNKARLDAAADEERRRSDRNLHDVAQQYLVARAIKARLIEQLSNRDPERARQLLHQLQLDATAALDELRALAHGIYPPCLL